MKGCIEIILPMERYETLRSTTLRRIILTLSSIGGISIVLTAIVTWILSARLSKVISNNIAREKLDTAMELAGAAAHEMRQPMTVVKCMISVIKEKAQRHETVTEQDIDLIHSQCRRMNDFIEKLLRITDYKTKPYSDGIRIMDIEKSSMSAGITLQREEGGPDRLS